MEEAACKRIELQRCAWAKFKELSSIFTVGGASCPEAYLGGGGLGHGPPLAKQHFF